MRRLVSAGLLPERAGQPARVWAHISLADLMVLDADSALHKQWTERVRGEWAGHRAAASVVGSDGAAWLDGDAAEGFACDASITPVVFGEVNPAVLDDLVRLCVQLARHGHGQATALPAATAPPAAPPPCPAQVAPLTQAAPVTLLTPPGPATPVTPPRPPRTRVPPRRGRSCCLPRTCSATRPSSGPSLARRSRWCPARAGWPRSCAGSSSAPASSARACRWMSGTATMSRPRSGTRSGCGISSASGPADASSKHTVTGWPTAFQSHDEPATAWLVFRLWEELRRRSGLVPGERGNVRDACRDYARSPAGCCPKGPSSVAGISDCGRCSPWRSSSTNRRGS